MDNLSAVSGVKDIVTKEYVDGKVTQNITDGVTTTAPSENAVHDALDLKANLASPTFTSTPAAPTAAVDTNTTQLATTAFVVAQAGASNPVMNGTVAVGTSKRYSRQDHVHASDTSRASTSVATTGANGLMSSTDKTKLDGVASSANNYVHPNHSGDVTSVADGATTIASDVVTNAKLANMAVNTIKGRVTTGTGDPEDLTATQARTILNIPTGLSAGGGTNAVIEGRSANTAAGNYAHAEGSYTTASGACAHVEGESSLALGSNSHAEGITCLARTANSHAEGAWAFAINGTIFAITAYDNTLKTVTLDSVTGLTVGDLLVVKITITAPLIDVPITDITGLVVTLNTTETLTSSWKYAIKKASTEYATHAEGANTFAVGNYAHSEGGGTIASGCYSHASGYNTHAKYAQTAIGQYNTIPSGSDAAYSAANELFIIGNGTSTSARGNAFKVLGDGHVYADDAYASTGADYAEYFEWLDGNINDEDRVGYFVTLDGEKIRKALTTDLYILGVISATPAIVGDNYEAWQGKYVTDEWGRVQYHDVLIPATDDEPERVEKHPIYNPDWDSSQEYISREKRKEWSPVGMTGKLFVRDDGTCQVNGFCKSNDDGIATASTTGYRVLKRVSVNMIKVFLK